VRKWTLELKGGLEQRIEVNFFLPLWCSERVKA